MEIKRTIQFAALLLVWFAQSSESAELCGSPAAITCTGVGSMRVCTFMKTASPAQDRVELGGGMGAACDCAQAGMFGGCPESAGIYNMLTVRASACTTGNCACSFDFVTAASFALTNTCVIDATNDGLPVELLEVSIEE